MATFQTRMRLSSLIVNWLMSTRLDEILAPEKSVKILYVVGPFGLTEGVSTCPAFFWNPFELAVCFFLEVCVVVTRSGKLGRGRLGPDF